MTAPRGKGRPLSPQADDVGPFARSLRTLRVRAGLSQVALADLTGLNVRSVGKYEGGHMPQADAAVAIAQALGTTVDAMFAEE